MSNSLLSAKIIVIFIYNYSRNKIVCFIYNPAFHQSNPILANIFLPGETHMYTINLGMQTFQVIPRIRKVLREVVTPAPYF